jgi:hypothetical protein
VGLLSKEWDRCQGALVKGIGRKVGMLSKDWDRLHGELIKGIES